MNIKEPIVLEPKGFDNARAWQECTGYVAKCGGIQHEGGEVNWRAAAGADPGIVSCPACGIHLWGWGVRLQCPDCSFEFPRDWWSMYSWGVGAAKQAVRYKHDARMDHPYYRYGFEHPVDDPWEEHDKIDWAWAVEYGRVKP